MGTKVFPTTNDVGGAGAGKVITEANLTALVKMLLGQAFVLSGFTVPASSLDLTLSVAAGEANIAGYRVVIDSATTVSCTASATNHIYLKLTRDASQNVTGAVFEVNTTGTPPVDSVKIATAVAGASSISSTTDARVLTPFTFSQVSGQVGTVQVADGAITAAKVAADVATQAELDAHAALTTTAHGGIVAAADVVTVATANKILKLDSSAKLPASITGDAQTVKGVDVVAKFDATTGHQHTGAAGDGPLIPDASLASGVDTAATANKIAKRDASGNLNAVNFVAAASGAVVAGASGSVQNVGDKGTVVQSALQNIAAGGTFTVSISISPNRRRAILTLKSTPSGGGGGYHLIVCTTVTTDATCLSVTGSGGTYGFRATDALLSRNNTGGVAMWQNGTSGSGYVHLLDAYIDTGTNTIKLVFKNDDTVAHDLGTFRGTWEAI